MTIEYQDLLLSMQVMPDDDYDLQDQPYRVYSNRYRRAGLDPATRLAGCDAPGVGIRAVAARPLRQDHSAAPVRLTGRCSRTTSTPTSSRTILAGRRCRCCSRRRCSTPSCPTASRTSPASSRTRSAGTWCRCTRIERASGPVIPTRPRDSLHEQEMWLVEGLTHRYPTKVLAEIVPTCPQYCGHCTRMDLVGNSTPQVQEAQARDEAGIAPGRHHRASGTQPRHTRHRGVGR